MARMIGGAARRGPADGSPDTGYGAARRPFAPGGGSGAERLPWYARNVTPLW